MVTWWCCPLLYTYNAMFLGHCDGCEINRTLSITAGLRYTVQKTDQICPNQCIMSQRNSKFPLNVIDNCYSTIPLWTLVYGLCQLASTWMPLSRVSQAEYCCEKVNIIFEYWVLLTDYFANITLLTLIYHELGKYEQV